MSASDFFAAIDALEETAEFEDNGDVVLTAATKDENFLRLTVELRPGTGELPQVWALTCHVVREHRIVLGAAYEPQELYEDHMLLWPYVQPSSSLSFYGKVEDPAAIIGSLCEQHQQTFGDWMPFSRFLNSSMPLTQLISGGFGSLAWGPEALIRKYQQVLEEAGIRTSLLPVRTGGQHPGVPGTEMAPQCLILGGTYVIASDFTAIRVDSI